MIDYQIKVFNSLPIHLEEQIESLKDICFERNLWTSEEKQEKQDQFCSKQDRFKFIIAFSDDKPIALVTCLKRSIIFQHKKVALGGIGGVCTHPEFRKQGIAHTLLQEGMQYLKDEGCDIAYLCTNKEKYEKLYEQVGFRSIFQHMYIGKSGKKYVDTNGMIAPIHSQKIFEEVLQSEKPFDIGQGNW